MKYLVVIAFVIQIALGAPNQPTIAEQTQQTIDKIQHNAQQAVQQFNAKVLEVTGSNSNVDLLTRVQTNAETYAKDIKGVADQIQSRVAENQKDVDSMIKKIAAQISESASNLLGSNDPTKVNQLQSTFQNVIQQADSLNTRLQTEGSTIQAIFTDALSKLYENTLNAAKNAAQQIDASQQPK